MYHERALKPQHLHKSMHLDDSGSGFVVSQSVHAVVQSNESARAPHTSTTGVDRRRRRGGERWVEREEGKESGRRNQRREEEQRRQMGAQ